MAAQKYRIGSGAAPQLSGGCAALCGSAFMIAGIAIGLFLYHPTIYDWWSARAWVETPCWIEKAEIHSSKGSKGSRNYSVKATYRYEFRGRTYHGERVGLLEGSDNFGDFQQRTYAELRRFEGSDRPYRCVVNPNRPEEAVLFTELRWGLLLMISLFPTLFPLVGGLVAFGGLTMAREALQVKALQKRHPEQPWKWKSEWAGDAITASKSGLGAFLAAAIWILIVQGPLAAAIVVGGLISESALAVLALLPCALALLPLWLAWKRVKARRTLGVVSLVPREWPLKSGGVLDGDLRLGAVPSPLMMLQVTARCVRQVTRRSGKNTTTSNETLWEHTETLSAAEARRDGSGCAIPLSMDLPAGLPLSDVESLMQMSGGRVEHLWTLDVSAGEGSKAQTLPLPVFIAEKETDTEKPADLQHAGERGVQDTAELASRLSARGLAVEFDAEGVPLSIFCPARRNRGLAITLLIFGAFWTVALAVIVMRDAPFIFKLVWGISAPVIDVLALWLLLNERRVTLAEGELRVENRAGPFYTKQQVLEARHIVRCMHDTNMTSNNQAFYRVRLETTFGKKVTLADGITEEATAAELARRLMLWKGRAE